jgi:glycerophosphoryl diester phosphodiesterase
MLRIGHRGAAGYAPENTLAAIKKAISLGADMVELDVQTTRDGQSVVFHDRRLDRMTQGKGFLAETTQAELQKLTVNGGHRIPTLDEALQAMDGKIGLMLELKAPGIAEAACEAVKRRKFSSPLIYASFFHQDLLRVRQLQPKAQTLALIVANPVDHAAFAVGAEATHVGVAFELLTKPFVDDMHRAGLQCFAFTVNDPADIKWIKSLEVDGIISDFPDRI